jgi:hypothetical protein
VEIVAVVVVISVAAGAAAVVAVVRLPADFLLRSPRQARSRVLRVVRMVAGTALVVVGVAMSVPGIPGPGFAVILLGALVMGNAARRLARRLLAFRPARTAIDRLRARFHRPPLAA